MLLMRNYCLPIAGSYELTNDLFVEIKPGLSSFADDPKKVIIFTLNFYFYPFLI